VQADAIFGVPDVIFIVQGKDISDMDHVIGKIAKVPEIISTDSIVARWIEGIEFPQV
jgi:hypothetical protein